MKYSDSGVNFDLVGSFRKELISHLGNYSKWKNPINIGHYAGLIDFGNYYLALHTDGVGTKTILALKHNYFREIGYDLIGMNVNDLASMNIESIAMVDYIASSVFNIDIAKQIGDSLDHAIKDAGISIIGGETASMPDLINGIDISGTVLGIVEKEKIVTGAEINEEDLIIGIPSSGFHSNGFSLIRKVLSEFPDLEEEIINGERFWKLLLRGTKLYNKLINEISGKYKVKGMAHITGGGFRNLMRLKKMMYEIEFINNYPEIFEIILEKGKISYHEAFQTFNMGIGFILIADKINGREILNEYDETITLGNVKSGSGVKIKPYGIKYDSYY